MDHGSNNQYEYWNQPADYSQDKKDPYEHPYNYYDPEEHKDENPADLENFEDTEIGEMDSKMPTFLDEETIMKIEWDRSKFNVCVTEVIKGSHTQYKIVGVDKIGEFDITRRYREFFALRTTLRKRWIGFYVPGIPAKKPLGNKDESIVNERWYLFNRFMQEVSLLKHLWDSDEMNAFLRPKLDVEKSLNLMGALPTEKALDRVANHTGVDYQTAQSASNKYKDSLRDFVTSSKEIFKFLEGFKNYAKKLEQIRKLKRLAHTKFSGFLSKYEESTVAVYGISDFTNNRVVSNTDDSKARDTMDELPSKIDNPYRKFKHWIKEEIIDFHALVEAISQRNAIEGSKHKAESKRRSSQSTLDKLNAGKKTLKTWFKSASSKANEITNLAQTIAQCDADIEHYEKMLVYVDMYLGDIALPSFKKKKVKSYFSCMKELSASEQSNYSQLLETWKVIYNAFNAKLQD